MPQKYKNQIFQIMMKECLQRLYRYNCFQHTSRLWQILRCCANFLLEQKSLQICQFSDKFKRKEQQYIRTQVLRNKDIKVFHIPIFFCGYHLDKLGHNCLFDKLNSINFLQAVTWIWLGFLLFCDPKKRDIIEKNMPPPPIDIKKT